MPLSFYSAARTVNIIKEKWYGLIGYFIIYTAVWLLTSNYIIVNGDLLISSAIKSKTHNRAVIIDLHKVFYKSGFDHTTVTLKIADRPLTLQGRPYIYFYLVGRENISISAAESFLGNKYLYTDEIPRREKVKARWLHFKDQIYRLRVIAAILVALILVGFLWPQKKFANGQMVSAKTGFWKMIGIVMAILFTIALVFYIALFVYVKYFNATRH
ncbi:hypothetical protein [Pedobacter jeongneungensis]|uniref:hypothetical protein n=1 Tax=Pedobacter jeongneungensis TaxID=947309 RepID=UPI0031D79568